MADADSSARFTWLRPHVYPNCASAACAAPSALTHVLSVTSPLANTAPTSIAAQDSQNSLVLIPFFTAGISIFLGTF